MNLSPISVTIKQATELTGLGRSTIYEAIAAGELTPRKRGTRTLLLCRDLTAWVEGFPTTGSQSVKDRKA